MSYIPRLKLKYKEEVVSKLMEEFKYGSSMEVPRLLKISIKNGGSKIIDRK